MSQTAIYEPIDISSSPQSISWTIDRIGDRSISNWNESMINNSRYLQDYVVEYNPINLNRIFD
jgi:intergrase/recombinase